MNLVGSFKTVENDKTYTVSIGTGISTAIVDPVETTVTPANNAVMFAMDPVTIRCDRQDLSKRIIISQATVNLVTNMNLTSELFSSDIQDIPMTISEGNNFVFSGYVDPLQFNQGFAHNWETVSVTATDPLGGLERKNIGQGITSGGATITEATEISPWNLILAVLNAVGITSVGYEQIDPTVKSALTDLTIHMEIFFGNSIDDHKTLYDVLDIVCRYFNLYIAMYDAAQAVIVSSIRTSRTSVPTQTISSFKDAASDASTNISTDDMYGQIKVTCNVEPVSDIIVQLGDDDYVYSDYSNSRHYMTEYISEGEGKDAWNAFYEIINDRNTTYDSAYTIDHYMYVLRNKAWKFSYTGPQGVQGPQGTQGYVDYMGGNEETGAPMTSSQHNLLTWLKEPYNWDNGYPSAIRCALVGFGSGDKNYYLSTDNSVPANISLTKYLVIATNGSYRPIPNTVTYDAVMNGYQAALEPLNTSPLCQYTGVKSAMLSPSDPQVKNFIVISGSILLNPIQCLTGPHMYTSLTTKPELPENNNDPNRHLQLLNTFEICKNGFKKVNGDRKCFEYTVPVSQNKFGSYYQQRWDTPYSGGQGAIYGFLNHDKNRRLQYNYSNYGDATDKISKLPILCCRLKVGDKYCCEQLSIGMTQYNKFVWRTAEQATQEGLPTYFTIGINPKLGDYIIGQSYSIANTISNDMNLDVTGTAIPIEYNDHLNGQVEFSILGPFNSVWNHIVKIPGSFWHSSSWAQGSVPLLPWIQSIMVKDLKVDIVSNNGLVNDMSVQEDEDIVYASHLSNSYADVMEETIDLCTPLTLAECLAKGFKYNASSNSYIYANDPNNPGELIPWHGFGTNTYTRPEECLVDYYYREYSTMSKIVDTQIKSSALTNGYHGSKLNDEMLCQGICGIYPGDNSAYRIMTYECDLKYSTINIKAREYKTINDSQIDTSS